MLNILQQSGRLRQPKYLYERQRGYRKTGKQRVHELLRQDPVLTVDQLVRSVGYARGHVRVWRKNFFAQGYEPTE